LARQSINPGEQSRSTPIGPLTVGTGRSIAHHGELLQGVFEDQDLRLHRGLITLPLASKFAVATFWPRSASAIRTRPSGKSKACRAAELTLAHLGHTAAGGDLTLESTIPVGHGYGSSTADVIASIRAVAAASGVDLRPSTISRLAVSAEGASDAIAHEGHAVLFAQREGRVIEYLGGELPPLLVVSARSKMDRPINTLDLRPARYDDAEIEQFRALRGLAARAIRYADARLLGRVSTVSALISQRRLPKSQFEAIWALAQSPDVCGIQVSHSGTLIGLLVDARVQRSGAKAAALARASRRLGLTAVEIFGVNLESGPSHD
jgi:uncharacterized protein involved in propanediol utilization